jgi:hypothetical protein
VAAEGEVFFYHTHQVSDVFALGGASVFIGTGIVHFSEFQNFGLKLGEVHFIVI